MLEGLIGISIAGFLFEQKDFLFLLAGEWWWMCRWWTLLLKIIVGAVAVVAIVVIPGRGSIRR